MKIKHLTLLIILLSSVYAVTFILSGDDESLSNQTTKSKSGLVVHKPLDKLSINDNKQLKKTDLNNKPPIVGEPNIDDLLPLPDSEGNGDQEVIEIGEYIDVDAEPISQDEPVIEIGEYIDVDAEPISQDDPVIEVGEFIDVDADQYDTEDSGPVINIGEFIDVD